MPLDTSIVGKGSEYFSRWLNNNIVTILIIIFVGYMIYYAYTNRDLIKEKIDNLR